MKILQDIKQVIASLGLGDLPYSPDIGGEAKALQAAIQEIKAVKTELSRLEKLLVSEKKNIDYLISSNKAA